jgi:hypothetical protein
MKRPNIDPGIATATNESNRAGYDRDPFKPAARIVALDPQWPTRQNRPVPSTGEG